MADFFSTKSMSSPVIIPPARHVSIPLAVPAPTSSITREGHGAVSSVICDPMESMHGVSPQTLSPLSRADRSEFPENMSMSTCSGKGDDSSKFLSSFPGSSSNTVNVSEKELMEKGISTDMQNERSGGSELKEKTSKAERRATQEAQRAAKALAKRTASTNSKQPRAAKSTPQKKEASKSLASRKNDANCPMEKDTKKYGPLVPQPETQLADKHRVEKAKTNAVSSHHKTRNVVELFGHLPQSIHGTQFPDRESTFSQLHAIHPSVYKVGLQYHDGDVTGGNARCITMLLAFREAIKDYSTPPEKTITRDLLAKISSYVSFLVSCRPLSISMGNAIRFLKNRITKLPFSLSEAEAKSILQSDIDRFINEKIVIAGKAIVENAVTKIHDGDVLLTYGSSSVVEMILLSAFKRGKQFRVVIVDSRPKLEGQMLLRRLVQKGLSCTYTHVNGISYIMHEVTLVFLGAASVFSNGTVYSRVGTACVAMVAHAFHVPVLICCEAYKFHNRAQLNSICLNELGDPDAISQVPGQNDVTGLGSPDRNENLQHLNLMYDLTPSDYISTLITDYGTIPATSVPVIIREYCKEQLWM